MTVGADNIALCDFFHDNFHGVGRYLRKIGPLFPSNMVKVHTLRWETLPTVLTWDVLELREAVSPSLLGFSVYSTEGLGVFLFPSREVCLPIKDTFLLTQTPIVPVDEPLLNADHLPTTAGAPNYSHGVTYVILEDLYVNR